jgi:hypothetical protein
MRFILKRKFEFIIYQLIINDIIWYPLGGGTMMKIWNNNTRLDIKHK